MFSHDQVLALFLGVGVLLLAARVLGEVARHLRQPAVLGELVAGLLLGPTVLGRLAPEAAGFLFPHDGAGAVVLKGLGTLAVALFLFAAGMEVRLSTAWRQGRRALAVSLGGLAVPFVLGFAAAWLLPGLFSAPRGNQLHLALFVATAMSISALPVIVRTLMDLNLYRSDLGMLVVPAAIVQDLIGWVVFAAVLGLAAPAEHARSPWSVLLLTTGFAVAMLTVGRWAADRALPYLQAYLGFPGGVLGTALATAMLCAALTEWIGIHAVFGAFLAGIALGDSQHLRPGTRATVEQFVDAFFAPIFFASIGLAVDLVADLDAALVLLVLAVACAGKLAGWGIAARLTGHSPRESWAIGLAMNARGAMEIILGSIALAAGLIDRPLFVALVITALATSLMAGPLIQHALRRRQTRRIADLLAPRAFVRRLAAATPDEAIRELVRVAAPAGLDAEAVAAAVLEREHLQGTGVGNHLAVPHARLPGLKAPVVAVGLSGSGLPFESPDGKPTRIVVLLLTSRDDDGDQLDLLADVSRLLARPEVQDRALTAAGYTEFLAALAAASHDPR